MIRSLALAAALLQAPVTLSITTSVQREGRIVPLNDQSLLLLDQDLTVILAKAGFQAGPGRSMLQAFAACETSEPNCMRGMQAMVAHIRARTQTDARGQARISDLKPGLYWLVTTAVDYVSAPVLWNVRVELTSGANSVELTSRNAVP